MSVRQLPPWRLHPALIELVNGLARDLKRKPRQVAELALGFFFKEELGKRRIPYEELPNMRLSAEDDSD